MNALRIRIQQEESYSTLTYIKCEAGHQLEFKNSFSAAVFVCTNFSTYQNLMAFYYRTYICYLCF